MRYALVAGLVFMACQPAGTGTSEPRPPSPLALALTAQPLETLCGDYYHDDVCELVEAGVTYRDWTAGYRLEDDQVRRPQFFHRPNGQIVRWGWTQYVDVDERGRHGMERVEGGIVVFPITRYSVSAFYPDTWFALLCDPDGDGEDELCTPYGYDEHYLDGVLDHTWETPVPMATAGLDRPGLTPLFWSSEYFAPFAGQPELNAVLPPATGHFWKPQRVGDRVWLVIEGDDKVSLVDPMPPYERIDVPLIFRKQHTTPGRFLGDSETYVLTFGPGPGPDRLVDLAGNVVAEMDGIWHGETNDRFPVVVVDRDGDGVDEVLQTDGVNLYEVRVTGHRPWPAGALWEEP